MPNRRRKSLWVLGISLLFYLIWFATDKITITSDAEGYMQGISSREPLYPSLLFLFRGIFGEGRYLRAVVLFQSVLAAAACWRLTMALTDKFNLKWFSVSVLLGVQFAVVLLCRFAAGRKSTYCVSIESEGIAIPLYLLFVTELLLFFWYAEYRNMILAGVWAVCLICTRKQMFMAVPILVICYLGLWLKKIISRKKGVLALSSVAVILLVSWGVNYLYSFVLRGELMMPTKSMAFWAVTTLYCSDLEDAERIEDGEQRELLRTILRQINEKEWNYQYAPRNWERLAHHYGDCYDLIQFEVMYPAVYDCLDARAESVSGEEREEAADQLTWRIITALAPENWNILLSVAVSNMFMGLGNTISKASPLLIWYNLIFTVAYIGFLIRNGVKKKNRDITGAAYIIGISTAVNIGVVGMTIFAQTRYMIYNMPLVYMGMYMLLWGYWNEKNSVSLK